MTNFPQSYAINKWRSCNWNKITLIQSLILSLVSQGGRRGGGGRGKWKRKRKMKKKEAREEERGKERRKEKVFSSRMPPLSLLISILFNNFY